MTTDTKQMRVRFAPSPTGNLHIGGARTAIYNWALARVNGGKFILRIEDTDPERSTPENTAQIMRSLAWLGINWDEGPEVGGSYGSYLQTQRFDLYSECLERLKTSGAVYPCFCTTDELNAKRDARQAAKESFLGYDGTCRSLGAEEVANRIAAGEPHTWRLKIPDGHGAVSWDDAVRGCIEVGIEQLDDFILVRTDSTPTYNFVVSVDDALMEITHVVRGDDHISNTPKQILVYEALGLTPPTFAHLSMILGADGKRLSKRHGATSVEAYQDEGYLPDALVNYLSLLGWSLDGETTIIDRETLTREFSLNRISKNPAIFDEEKLRWMNLEYIKAMGASAFIDALLPWLERAGFARNGIPARLDGDSAEVAKAVKRSVVDNREWYENIYPLIAERAKTLADAIGMIGYLFSGDSVPLDAKSVDKCLKAEGIDAVLATVISTLSNETLSWEHEPLETALRADVEALAVKPKTLFQAVRVAICGNMVSPPLFESLELIGRKNTLARLETALALI